jgi:hypothetical protein
MAVGDGVGDTVAVIVGDGVGVFQREGESTAGGLPHPLFTDGTRPDKKQIGPHGLNSGGYGCL